jgi:hypothetical protein
VTRVVGVFVRFSFFATSNNLFSLGKDKSLAKVRTDKLSSGVVMLCCSFFF